jgi:hypothetical protein
MPTRPSDRGCVARSRERSPTHPGSPASIGCRPVIAPVRVTASAPYARRATLVRGPCVVARGARPSTADGSRHRQTAEPQPTITTRCRPSSETLVFTRVRAGSSCRCATDGCEAPRLQRKVSAFTGPLNTCDCTTRDRSDLLDDGIPDTLVSVAHSQLLFRLRRRDRRELGGSVG